MNTVAIEIGKYLCEIFAQFLAGNFLEIKSDFLTFFFITNASQDVHQRYILSIGIHGNICQRSHTVSGKRRHALVSFVQSLNNEVHLAS